MARRPHGSWHVRLAEGMLARCAQEAQGDLLRHFNVSFATSKDIIEYRLGTSDYWKLKRRQPHIEIDVLYMA